MTENGGGGPSPVRADHETSSPDSNANSTSVSRSNEAWRAALHPPYDSDALEDLRAELVRGLGFLLHARVPQQAGALAEDFAQDAMVQILASVDSFRGESRFMTWALKIAVRIALTELRRKRWKDFSLESLSANSSSVPRPISEGSELSTSPEQSAIMSNTSEIIQQTIAESLSDRQRLALQAVMFQGVPLEEVARRMGTSRNALYKLLHDARLRLKRALEARNLRPEDLLVDVG